MASFVKINHRDAEYNYINEHIGKKEKEHNVEIWDSIYEYCGKHT